MSRKTRSKTPCCDAPVQLGDGGRLVACPACGLRWGSYTAGGTTIWNHNPEKQSEAQITHYVSDRCEGGHA